MSEILVSARGIGKRYLRLDTATARIRHVLSPRASIENPQWALYPCDLDIARGEALGIVGRNGSGKSTLLSIIAGILTPTVGTIATHGRISALLELGSGFNPEFTGRENAYYNGMLHGFSRAELDERFASIASFAEIGDFIERPVKTYSSGMFVRLAFAVAVSVDPDILIIDEALSVGDVFFQQKCFERLRELRANGTTLLFVSHDSGAVYRFCDRAILLDGGRIAAEGSPKEVIETYEAALISLRDSATDERLDAPAGTLPVGDGELAPAAPQHEIQRAEDIELLAVGIHDEAGNEVRAFVSEANVAVGVTARFLRDFADPHIGFKIRNRFGEVVFETNSYCMRRSLGPVARGDVLAVQFPFRAALAAGEYSITLGVANDGYGEGLFRHQLVYRHDLIPFSVLRNADAIQWDGVINLFPELVVERR